MAQQQLNGLVMLPKLAMHKIQKILDGKQVSIFRQKMILLVEMKFLPTVQIQEFTLMMKQPTPNHSLSHL